MGSKGIQVQQEAEQYLSEENELVEDSDVLQGVNDILAEKISDERNSVRKFVP